MKGIRGDILPDDRGGKFQEAEDGKYLIFKQPMKETYIDKRCGLIKSPQLVCSVWPAYKFDSYVRIFEKEAKKMSLVAEWTDKVEPYEIVAVIDRLKDYYFPNHNILIGIGRNTWGVMVINKLESSKRYYNLFSETRRDVRSGGTIEEIGILEDDENRTGLIMDLKQALLEWKIDPPDRYAEALKSIEIIDNDKCIISEKQEANIMSLAGACRMVKEEPYKEPKKRREIKRPLNAGFRF